MSALNVKIGGDATGFRRAIGDVRKATKTARRDIETTGKMIGGAFMGPLAGGMAVTSMVMLGKAAIDAADNIGKGATRTAMSAEEYQRLSAMANLAGSSINAVETSIVRMSRVLKASDEESKTAQRALDQLGVSMDDLRDKGTSETFAEIAQAIAAVEDPVRRLALAQEVFGRGAIELMPMIQNYASLRDEVSSLNVMTNEAVAAAEKYKDEVAKLGITIQTALVNSGFIEHLSEVAQEFGAISKAISTTETRTGKLAEAMRQYLALTDFTGLGRKGLRALGAETRTRAEREADEGQAAPTADEVSEAIQRRRQRKIDEAKRKANAEAAQKAIVEEAAAAAAQKELDAAEKIQNAIHETISSMEHAVEIQDMKNRGLEREAAIMDAIFRATRRHGELTENQVDAIQRNAGILFDLSQKMDADSAASAADTSTDFTFRNRRDTSPTALERIGAIMGGGISTDPGVTLQKQVVKIAERQLAVQEQIRDKTGSGVLTEV